LFVAFDAEEMGTLGAKYFLENCPIDKKKIEAMINLDMIGRMKSDSLVWLLKEQDSERV
jgi:Zn-dependent M28 family amino/carboxypeptidase